MPMAAYVSVGTQYSVWFDATVHHPRGSVFTQNRETHLPRHRRPRRRHRRRRYFLFPAFPPRSRAGDPTLPFPFHLPSIAQRLSPARKCGGE